MTEVVEQVIGALLKRGRQRGFLTMAEVHGRIDAMIDYRVARYEAVRGDSALSRLASN